MDKLKDKKLFLLDMDGTIYLENTLFEGVLDFLDYIKHIGGRYMFLTNNSSKSVDKYLEKLRAMNVPAKEENFLTSADAAAIYLNKHFRDKTIYALGTESFKSQLKKSGLMIVDTLQSDISCLVMGFDTELTFQKLEDACILLGRGAEYVATNPDWVCPTWYGYVPDCGCVAEMLYRATKRRPVFIGKPQPEMALLAIEKSGFDKSETIIIGDRIYTDIACGVNAGITTALVLSGETKQKDVEESEIKPDYIFRDISALHARLT
jgi:HAD superfamily hydrolase (TIGR01457 family)